MEEILGNQCFCSESGKKRERVRARFKTIVQKMNDNDCIRYFTVVHKNEMTKRYNYVVHNENKQFVPKRMEQAIPFDEKRCIELHQRSKFNILSVSRLEFPHKGFVIGLIKVYGILKQRYPNIRLTIVGYGDGLNMVQEEIKKLDFASQKDINVVGKVAPDDLLLYYNDANVCVSLAGCFSIGARNGTLSLPVRHYTYDCETYGFLPESKRHRLSVEPGQPIIDYLEKIINMDMETYVSMCRKCYESYNNIPTKTVRESIYSLSDSGNKCVLTVSDILFLWLARIKSHLHV